MSWVREPELYNDVVTGYEVDELFSETSQKQTGGTILKIRSFFSFFREL